MDDPENPRIMEDLIRALGGEPVVWAATQRMLRRLCGAGERAFRPQEEREGAAATPQVCTARNLIVTACPLCQL